MAIGEGGVAMLDEWGMAEERLGEEGLEAFGWFLEELEPQEVLPLAEWAEKHFRPPDGPVGGRLRVSTTPYMREPMEALGDDGVTSVTLVWGAQTGKTLLEMAFAMWTLAYTSDKTMVALPTEDLIEVVQQSRYLPALKACEPVLERVPLDTKGEPSSRALKKQLWQVGAAMVIWASVLSDSQSVSSPIKTLILDEVGLMAPGRVGRVELRTESYSEAGRKIVKAGTVYHEEDALWLSYEASDKRQWRVPCLKCGERFSYEWEHLKWTRPEHGKEWSREQMAARLKAKEIVVRLECPACGHPHTNEDKEALNAGGVWESTADFSGVDRGYLLPGLASPFASWQAQVARWYESLASVGDEKRMEFQQQVLSRPWKVAALRVEEQRVWDRVSGEAARGRLPWWTQYLVVAADVQAEYVEWGAWAYGPRRMRLVDHGKLEGANALDWLASNVAQRVFYQDRPDGGPPLARRPDLTLVDSNYRKDDVLTMAAKNAQHRVFAVSGRAELSAPILATPTPMLGGGQVVVYQLRVNDLKNELHAFFRGEWGEQEGEGISFHEAIDKEWARQFTSEERVPVIVGRERRRMLVWRVREGYERNEQWDTGVYGFAGATVLGWDPQAGGDVVVPVAAPARRRDVPTGKTRRKADRSLSGTRRRYG